MSGEYTLPRSHIDRSFQIMAELNVPETVEKAIWFNADLIYKWIKIKFPSMPLLDEMHVPFDFSRTKDGNTVSIFRETNHFCCKIEHPDIDYPRRNWTVEAEIISSAKRILFGVKVTYTTPEDADYPRNIFSVPDFIKKIANLNGFKDVRELNGKVLTANSAEKLNELYELITDPNRIFPVIVVTDLIDKGKPIFEPELLSTNVGFIAHVAHIPSEQTRQWKAMTGEKWDVYNGAVRTYYKNVDFRNTEDLYRHPLCTAKEIADFEYVNEYGEKKFGAMAFFAFLVEKIKNNDNRMRLDWKSRGHKFFFAAHRAAESKKLTSEKETIKNEIEKSWEDLFEEATKEFEKEKLEAEIEQLDLMEEIESLKKKLDEEKSERFYFRNRIKELEQQLADADKIVDIIPKESDCKLKDIAPWVETYFPDKIVLLPKVKNSLKTMKHERPRLFYEAMQLFGTEYWQMRQKNRPSDAPKKFEDKLKALHLEKKFCNLEYICG